MTQEKLVSTPSGKTAIQRIGNKDVYGSTVIHSDGIHLFEHNNDKMMFDIASGMVLELSDFAYEFLDLCRQKDWPQVVSILKKKYADLSEDEMKATLEQLKAKGLFTKPPDFDEKTQEERIQELWLHHPYRLQLVIAQCCNLACVYCYMENNQSNARKSLMSTEQAFQAVDHLIERSGRRRNLQVTFFGGEPLLNFQRIKDVVRYCKDVEQKHNKKFMFELITNGTLLDGEIADFVIENDMLLFISLDGWREMHNKQRPSINGTDYHHKILSNAERMDREHKKGKLTNPVKVRANLTPEFHNVKSVVNFFQSHGFTTIGISAIQDLPYSEGKTPGALSRQQMEELETASNETLTEGFEQVKRGRYAGPYATKMLRKMVYSLSQYHNTMGIRCGVGRNTNAADVDGNIYPCHRYVNMEKYILGNTKTGMDEEKTKAYYRKLTESTRRTCSKCWIRHFCAGGCPWERSAPDGTICDPINSECDNRRRGVERALWIRKELRKANPRLFAAWSNNGSKNDDLIDALEWDDTSTLLSEKV
jgi:uncharacterized protein